MSQSGPGPRTAGRRRDRPAPRITSGAGWPATTRSTSPGSTRSSTPACSCRCSGRCTARGSGSGCAAWSTCPASGAALVVANHSGVLPFDALMLQAGVFDEHPPHRVLRVLSADLVYEVPVLSGLARRSGHVRADPEQADQAAGRGPSRRRVPRGLQGHRQAVQRAVPAAALRAGRVRRDRPAGGRADHPVRDRGRRGDLPDDRELAGGGPAARGCRTSRSRRCSRGSARWAPCRCRPTGSSSSARRCRPTAPTGRARTRRSRPSRTTCGTSSRASSMSSWSSAARPSASRRCAGADRRLADPQQRDQVVDRAFAFQKTSRQSARPAR